MTAGPGRRFVGVDLDGTICDTRHRDHLLADAPKSRAHGGRGRWDGWTNYSLACVDDTPIAGTIALVQLLAELGYEPAYITGRDACAWDETSAWLRQHELPHGTLTMRNEFPEDRGRNNGALKAHRIGLLQTRGHVVLHIDDYPRVVAPVEALGVPVLLVKGTRSS